MGKCRHFDVCKREATGPSLDSGFCILHSPDPQKSVPDFIKAFHEHVSTSGNTFANFVFPARFSFRKGTSGTVEITTAPFPEGALDWHGPWLTGSGEPGGGESPRVFDNWTEEPVFSDGADFTGSIFLKEIEFTGCVFNRPGYIQGAKFRGCTFAKGAKFRWCRFPNGGDFKGSLFQGDADFTGSRFENLAEFGRCKITNRALFSEARFAGVYFSGVEFDGPADFSGTTFEDGAAYFNAVKFRQGANFRGALFKVPKVSFAGCSFRAITAFTPRRARSARERTTPAFENVETDFRDVEILPPDALHFQGADFRKCLFFGTNLRRAGLVDVLWPPLPLLGKRQGLYDEALLIESRKKKKSKDSGIYGGIENIYRSLKQNYEEQRDFERAGHFHYGEKEMRRQNPMTPFSYRTLLWLYWALSGYGERLWRLR